MHPTCSFSCSCVARSSFAVGMHAWGSAWKRKIMSHVCIGLWGFGTGRVAALLVSVVFIIRGSFQVLYSAVRGWPHHLALGVGAGRTAALQVGVAFVGISFQAPNP